MRKVVGLHSVREALKVRPKSVRNVFVREGLEKNSAIEDIVDLARRNKVPVLTKNEKFLKDLSFTHQGVGCEVLEDPAVDFLSLKESEQSIVLLLDSVEDPHNLGAILRTAWLMGASALFLPKDRSVSLTPTACKSASGGAEHVPVEVVTNLSQTIDELKEWGFWIYGLGFENSKSIWKEDFPQKVALVLGSEGTGMREKTQKHCDIILNIWQTDPTASLNVSASAAIALAEVRRQWNG
ncbi:MAG: 23S rRNA (guanosine(2251)-2'-O)-methyltransferase RlmB [Bdellovibrionales bacterium]|nr:23S rRNA (guanosine(2251)-2'-O)-methyltransferase RlmB [Bdellovibrionales bacterium]